MIRAPFVAGVLLCEKEKNARALLLGILGRGVPPGSPNPDPISDQKL